MFPVNTKTSSWEKVKIRQSKSLAQKRYGYPSFNGKIKQTIKRCLLKWTIPLLWHWTETKMVKIQMWLKKMQFLVPQFPSWRWWIVICIHNFAMFSLDADNRKLCIFHYELWRTFVVKVSLTQFHNFFWNFDTFKAWGGGVGESVLYVYMYVHIRGSDRGRFLLMWRVLDRCELDRVSWQWASLLLFSFWLFNILCVQFFNFTVHLRWPGINASATIC